MIFFIYILHYIYYINLDDIFLNNTLSLSYSIFFIDLTFIAPIKLLVINENSKLLISSMYIDFFIIFIFNSAQISSIFFFIVPFSIGNSSFGVYILLSFMKNILHIEVSNISSSTLKNIASSNPF